jgi:hypothetical protein
MNKKILVFGFIFIFLSTLLSGCEEVEDVIGPGIQQQDYIVVTVIAEMCVINDTFQTYLVNEPIDIKIIKAGGERFEGVPTTDSNGCTSAHTTFNLYKEQPIVAKAYPTYHPYLFQQKTLEWEVVKSQAVQNAFTWNPYFLFVV